MKRFTVPCDFNGVKHPFHVYIGEPHPKKHPLQFQAWWLSSERGGTIPQDVMDSFEKLFKIAQENNVSFEDLCVYALGTAQEENAQAEAAAGGGSSYNDNYAPQDGGGNYGSDSGNYGSGGYQEEVPMPIMEQAPPPRSFADEDVPPPFDPDHP